MNSAERRRSRGCIPCRRRSGFTLLELLTVMGIMAIIMSMVAVAWYGMGRGVRGRGAVENVVAVVSLARQYAITRGAEVTLHFGKDPVSDEDYYYATYSQGTNASRRVKPPTYLPPAIVFTNAGGPIVESVTFMPNGSLKGESMESPILRIVDEKKAQGESGLDVRIRINSLTGLVSVPDEY